MIIEVLEKRGVKFKALDQSEIDATTSSGKLLLGILARVAEFERAMIRERQAEGIKQALERGQRFGPKPKADNETVVKVRALRAEGKLVREIMAETALGKATVYRALRRAE